MTTTEINRFFYVCVSVICRRFSFGDDVGGKDGGGGGGSKRAAIRLRVNGIMNQTL